MNTFHFPFKGSYHVRRQQLSDSLGALILGNLSNVRSHLDEHIANLRVQLGVLLQLLRQSILLGLSALRFFRVVFCSVQQVLIGTRISKREAHATPSSFKKPANSVKDAGHSLLRIGVERREFQVAKDRERNKGDDFVWDLDDPVATECSASDGRVLLKVLDLDGLSERGEHFQSAGNEKINLPNQYAQALELVGNTSSGVHFLSILAMAVASNDHFASRVGVDADAESAGKHSARRLHAFKSRQRLPEHVFVRALAAILVETVGPIGHQQDHLDALLSKLLCRAARNQFSLVNKGGVGAHGLLVNQQAISMPQVLVMVEI